MHHGTPRRDFVKTTLALGLLGSPFGAIAAAGPSARRRLGANGKLAVAKIAVGGMGASDLEQVSSHPDVAIVALCDTNREELDRAGESFKDAQRFSDWREMLSQLDDKIDAVVVSTPDHSHAVASLSAMEKGKHVYCQKPLARAASENRALAEAVRKYPKVVTQMGTQRSATAERRLAYKALRDGIVGKVSAIHAWTDRPAGWWPSGNPRPTGDDPIPPYLNWNTWLGPAPFRPYVKDVYTPFKWRGTRDFGTGAIGDMACHIVDIPFYALELGLPARVFCDSSDGTTDEFPNAETITMRFAPTPQTAGSGCEFYWYDGGRMPDFKALGLPESLKPSDRKEADEYGLKPLPRDGAAILVGERGLLVIPIQWQDPFVVDRSEPSKISIQKIQQTEKTTNHWHDWVDACLGKGPEGSKTRAPFDLAGLLCETLSVGAVSSLYSGKSLRYLPASFSFEGESGSAALLKPTPREGWNVPGL